MIASPSGYTARSYPGTTGLSMTDNERTAGYRLLETGTAVSFRITGTETLEGPDAAEFSLRVELAFPSDPDSEENDLEWGAFGFLFVLGTLSFDDAGPREISVIHYVESDEFQVDDFMDCLQWEGGALKFDADYVRGRRMKTRIVLRPDGSGTLTTAGRGKSALRWLE
jgi:hypothetical protein